MDAVGAFLDLAAGQEAVCSEVNESLFLTIQLCELLGQLLVHRAGQLLLASENAVEVIVDGVDEVVREFKCRVVPGDRFLDEVSRQVWQVATTLLPRTAQEVAVALPVAAPSLGVDEPADLLVAAVAEQEALEVVL